MAGLTSKMKLCAEILVNEPEKPIDDVANELGVHRATIWKWRQREDYKAYEHELCHERFLSLEKLAIQKLKENATKGNQRAVEYLLDYIGYKATEKVDVRSGDININIVGDVE
jgi:hypothetical protein